MKRDVYLSYDMSVTQDLTCVGIAIPVGGKIFVDAMSFCPAWKVTDKKNPHRRKYATWKAEGVLTTIDHPVIDQDVILQYLLGFKKDFKIKQVAYDRIYGSQIALKLDQAGVETLVVPQTTMTLSPMMRKVEDAVASERIIQCGNPILRWQLGNVVVEPDRNENIFPRKTSKNSKIDGAVVLIMALAAALGDARQSKIPVIGSILR